MVPMNIFEALAQGQMLSIIFFSILFGFLMTKIGEKQRDTLMDVFNAALAVIMKITLFIIRFAPLGIFSITAKVIAQQVEMGNNIGEVVGRLGLYVITVLAGLLFHGLITLPVSCLFYTSPSPRDP